MVNIVIFGNGSREHVIIEKLLINENINKIYTIDNNDFIKNNKICNNLKSLDDILKNKENIDLVIFGPEKYLVEGYVDILEKNNIKCFGPNKNASNLEGSKIFSKKIMEEYNINTAKYNILNDYNSAKKFIENNNIENYVIKLSGLANGKGVFLPNTKEEYYNIIDNIYINNNYGENKNIIIEERLYGTEVSIMGFCNGNDIFILPQIQDFKRLEDNNIGINTGGMGAFGPVNILNKEELIYIKEKMSMIVKDLNYVGILYAGIMKTNDNIYILEFNCRFGDPECQVLLNLLENDLYNIIYNCVNNNKIELKIKNKYVCNIVLSETNYPNIKNKELFDLNLNYTQDDIDKYKINIYTSNLKNINNIYYSYGGRIMSIVSTDNLLYKTINNCYNFIKNINYKNIYYRKDIGLKHCLINNNLNISKNIAILSSGTGNSCKKLIKMIDEKKLNSKISIIITNKSNADIINKAKDNNISYLYLPIKENYEIQLLTILKSYNIDIIFLVGYMKIIKSIIIDAYKNRIFNIHPSLLPKYSGLLNLNIHENVIKNNDIYTGCTLHIVNEKIDDGNIIIQKQIKVNTKNPLELKTQIQELENDCIVECIKLIENGYINNKLNYNDCGVNINKGNEFVNVIKNILQENKNIGKFCSIYDYNNIKIAASTDGVGSKLEIANKLNDYSNIGIDLVAMCVNDLIVHGAKPLFMLDYIALNKLNIKNNSEIIKSIYEGCKIANCQLLGGETAELSSIFYPTKYDLAGFSVGIIENDIYPKIINKDDIILGMYSNGVHSNGYSLILELLKSYNFSLEILNKPTKIYVNEVLELINNYSFILGFAHITGGGLIDNIPRILPQNLNFCLNKVWNVDNVFTWIKDKTNLNQLEMLNTFNCGIGMIVIVSKNYDKSILNKYNMIEIGKIIESQNYQINIDLFS